MRPNSALKHPKTRFLKADKQSTKLPDFFSAPNRRLKFCSRRIDKDKEQIYISLLNSWSFEIVIWVNGNFAIDLSVYWLGPGGLYEFEVTWDLQSEFSLCLILFLKLFWGRIGHYEESLKQLNGKWSRQKADSVFRNPPKDLFFFFCKE